MSDLHDVVSKTKEGAEWRGTIRVSMDGEDKELTVRQLFDREFEEVMDLIDRDELGEFRDQLQDNVDEETLEEYRDLRDADEELDEDEEARLDELEDEVKSGFPDIFEVFSTDTFEGIRRCAKYGVEPDEDDLRDAFTDTEYVHAVEAERGIQVKTPEDLKPALQDQIDQMVEQSTNFTAFTIGLQVLTTTLGDEGN